jgi:hypothetical protein
MSPIPVAVATKFHPTHGVGPTANPLYKTPLRVNYPGFVGKEFMSESSEVSSDLDGHTLSCSLELMSDMEGMVNVTLLRA